MTTTGPHDWPSPSADAFGSVGGAAPLIGESAPDRGAFDPLLIQQTKNEIRALVQEITQLSRASIPASQFYEEFLRRVVAALAAPGGAVWTVRDGGTLELAYQVNLPAECHAEQDAVAARHNLLLQNVLNTGQATLVPPRSGSARDEEAGNPTEYLLVLAALRLDQRPCGVIEVFQRAGGGPTTQRGYLRFLVQMCDLAGEFLRNLRLRDLDDRQGLWSELEHFLRRVHGRLDSQAVAYIAANEGRRLLGCDRLSVTVARGRRHAVRAVSGLDALDRRAADVQLLGRLASAVCAAGRPLWYDGRQRDLAPQIEKHLDAYLDRAHATALAVVPLIAPAENAGAKPREECASPIGALIVERLSGQRAGEGLVERTEAIAGHCASALANALEHESLFLLPVWRALGKAKWMLRARALPKVFLVLAATLGVALALALIPVDFDVAANGKLQPAVRRDVFAHTDGVVMEVPVRHEQMVEQGQVLARLSNTEIEVQIADLIGRKRATQERILSLQRAQLDGRRLRMEEQNRLSGELLELREVEDGIDRELELLRTKEAQLVVRSEMRGQVVTWNVGSLLMRRPVQRGQLLMTLLDLAGDWELELYLPEARLGHVGRAASRDNGELRATFLLASHPERSFTGRVVEIHRLAEVRGEDGNCVALRVAIDKRDLPELRSETSVTVRVHCGRRSVGYVLFHELFETVQRRVLFWL